jgi:hypothetical protein
MKTAIILRVIMYGVLISAICMGYVKIVLMVLLSFGFIIEVGKIFVTRKARKMDDLTLEVIRKMQAKRAAEAEKDITVN